MSPVRRNLVAVGRPVVLAVRIQTIRERRGSV